MNNNHAIGVFDSGIGGISVLSCLKQVLPTENFVYFGDMARVPYGTKSKHTVVRYAIESAEILLKKSIKLLVIACNTATALALPEVYEATGIPVIGVIQHSAEKACSVSKNGHVALIATEGTVASKSYEAAIYAQSPHIKVSAKSCGLLVALAEEGYLDHPVTEMVLHDYLDPFFKEANPADTLILGCTHYPFLYKAIQRVVDNRMQIVDPAHETAEEVKQWLVLNQKENRDKTHAGHIEYLVSDAKPRFLRLAQSFLGEIILPEKVTVVEV